MVESFIMDVRAFLVALAIALAVRFAGAQAADQRKPYGRACVTVVDAAAKTETVFTPEMKPGNERSVVVHLDANSSCEALVAAFIERDGSLAFGWRPVFLALSQWDEKTAGGDRWPWKQTEEPFEIVVLFFAPGSADAAQIKKLFTAMQESPNNSRLLEIQTNKLHELIGHAMADKDLSRFRAKAETADVAGVTRGDSFPWRRFARDANFMPELPGALIFSSGPAK